MRVVTSTEFGIESAQEHDSSYRKALSRLKATMLYLVGLGLADEKDITVRGLEIVRRAARVYLEAYTSILLVDQPVLVCAT